MRRAVLALMIASVCSAHAQVTPAQNEEQLFVTVIRNQQPLPVLLDVLVDNDKVFIKSEDASKLGLRVEKPQPRIDLSQTSGVTYSLDRSSQSLMVDIETDYLITDTQRFGSNDTRPPLSPDVSGVKFEYDVSGYSSNSSHNVGFWGGVSTLGGKGQFTQTFRANTTYLSKASTDTARLDTFWLWSNPDKMYSVSVGDSVTGSLDWSRSARFAGIKIGRDFSLQPYNVITPRTIIQGSAALPSTVDLLIDGVLNAQQPVQPGRFEFDTPLPVIGAGNATVVITDLNGLQQQINVPLYGAQGLLQQGLTDGSLELGVLREQYGIDSWSYNSTPFVSGTVRRGINDALTMEAHAEWMNNHYMAGMGAVYKLPARLGVLSGSYAQSEGGANNTQHKVGWQWNNKHIGVNASTTRSGSNFLDIVGKSEGFDLPSRIDQAWIGFPSKIGQWNVGYIRQDRLLQDEQLSNKYASLSWSSQWRNMYTNINVFHDLSDDSTQAFASLTIPLGRHRAQISQRHATRTDPATTLSLSQPLVGDEPGWGWMTGVSVTSATDIRNAWLQVDRQNSVNRWQAGLNHSFGQTSAWGNVRGSVVALSDMGVFPMRQAGGAFAVVSTGIGDVPVSLENRPIGRTNDNGLILVERLNPWQNNKMSINPNDLQSDVLVVGQDEQLVVPRFGQGARVQFQLQHATIIQGSARFNDEWLAAGTRIELRAQDNSVLTTTVVGHDGQIWADITQFPLFHHIHAPAQQCDIMPPTLRPARSVSGTIDFGELVCE